MVDYTATRTAIETLAKIITQAGHGFEVGTIVIYDFGVTGYVRALADSEVNCSGAMMVSYVYDANRFTVTQTGYVTNLTLQDPYTVGAIMYVSPTNPGELTYVKPTSVGQVELECFYPISTTSGYFFGGSGDLNESGALFQWHNVNSNTVMQSNNGYITSGAGAISLQLPAAPVDGDILKIATMGTGVLTITVPNLSDVRIVDQITASDGTGTVTLQPTGGQLKGTLELLCITPIIGEWIVMNGTGIWVTA